MKILYLLCLFAITATSQFYFPPLESEEWETIDPSTLKWDESKIEDLYSYLEAENTRAFIVLKGGRIVLEKYFGEFTKDSNWYWASAGKTVTAALVGIAQENGLLDISEPSSKYLGSGWTSMPSDKEQNITIWHHLTMTTGLDDSVDDLDCTDSECLKFLAEPGTRWSYHNAPYTLLRDVVVGASNLNYNQFYYRNLANKIGMNGLWLDLGYINLLTTTPRSMARFGIMTAANGIWNGEEIIKDKDYLEQSIITSQDLNKSYGYLWWLNGKESYMVPGFQQVLDGDLMPNSPKDVYNALGKNGQILSISPSNDLIFVRMGDSPDGFPVPFLLADEIWKRLSEIMLANSVELNNSKVRVYPNPTQDYLKIENFFGKYEVCDLMGKSLIRGSGSGKLDLKLTPGIYILRFLEAEKSFSEIIIIN